MTIFHLKNIRYSYGTKTVLDVPELTLKSASITGIMGPNGGGKSTLLKLLAFVMQPTHGQIFYRGKVEMPFSPAVRSKVTLLTQKPYLLKRSVYENIAYGLKIRKDTRDIARRVNLSLETVGLEPFRFADRKWHELSGGEAQRVALAARLILKPDVLLLDEPIANVDSESAGLIRKASLSARKNMGTSLVIVSHDIQWLYSISDKQLSVYKGKIFSSGMKNIISGPFVPSKHENMLIKELADGQRILLCQPDPSPDNSPENYRDAKSAIINKKNLRLEPETQAAPPFLNQLHGEIRTMILEKKSGFILVTIAVSDLTFAVRLSQKQVGQQELHPGKKVVLGFRGDEIEWV